MTICAYVCTYVCLCVCNVCVCFIMNSLNFSFLKFHWLGWHCLLTDTFIHLFTYSFNTYLQKTYHVLGPEFGLMFL